MVSESPVAAALSRLEQFQRIRRFTTELCAHLEPEDQVIQSMPDVSPTRWHLAHTTWFFETFVLGEFDPSYEPLEPIYGHLFNSYYQTIGAPFPRERRGLLSRPTVREVLAYRAHVDAHVEKLLAAPSISPEIDQRLELGGYHEQQHQELLLMDIKHVFSCNPIEPPYHTRRPAPPPLRPTLSWLDYPGGIVEIGHAGDRFGFDNESPRHRVILEPFQLADRLVTNGEYLEFLEDDGYVRSEFWLALGFDEMMSRGWTAPLYWRFDDETERWYEFTLSGRRELDLNAPVSHVSYFEADAFARWADARLPTEGEWETVATDQPVRGNFVDNRALEPLPALPGNGTAPRQLFGDLWEWTQSPYLPYPGFRVPDGAVGEYNGKFMCNQYVLRGGSCVTSADHVRATYRNFFPPEARWAFAGIRLAR